MYHSVTFTLPGVWSKNSHEDFHLVPDGRPIISMPAPVTNFIEVPGASGPLDLSESLTGYPLYGNREGSLSFIVLNDYQGDESWIQRYQMISKFIHGRRLELVLEDDPNYFYEGRFTIENWESPSDGGNSTVSIGYALDTYKYWDTELSYVVTVAGSSNTLYFSSSRSNLGIMPVIPTIEVSSVNGNITLEFSNPEIFSGTLSHTISHAATYRFQDVVLSDMSGDNMCSIKISGRGTVVIRLRNGEL